jgi:hypothetical protein
MTVATSDTVLGLTALSRDVQFHRVPEAQRGKLVDLALQDGRHLARQAGRQWGNDPFAIAARCQVPVIESHAEAGFGSTVIYAEYAVRPPSITLYTPAIRRLDALVARQPCFDWRIERTLPVFLAHELYHHFDCMRGREALIRRQRATILKLGRWTWTAGLSTLPEIAAGAFAQQLLGLGFHPKLLDALVTGRNL